MSDTTFPGPNATREEIDAWHEENQTEWLAFDGDDNCGPICRGWDGASQRCDCGNRRVYWDGPSPRAD